MLKVTILQNSHPHIDLQEAVDAKRVYNIPIPNYLLEQYTQVAHSQYKIAKYLKQNPNIPVINENQPGIEAGNKDYIELIRTVFPTGLPERFNKLSEAQKNYLILLDGIRVAYYLNIISKTYSDHRFFIENVDIFFKKFNTHFIDYRENIKKTVAVDQGREYLALKNAICIANETSSDEIIIIYGKMHYFKDVAKCFSNIKLNFVDLSCLDLSANNADTQYMHNLIKEVESYHQEADCETIDKILYSRPEAIDTCTFVHANAIDSRPSLGNDESQQSNINAYYATGTIALLGVLAFGLFNCCRKTRNKETAVELQNKEQKQKVL